MGGMGKKKEVEEYRFSRRKGLVNMREMIRFARFVAKRMGFKISVDGLDIQEIDGGVHLKGSGGEGDSRHPFFVQAFSDGASGFNFTVEPGTYNSGYPTLGGVPLNAAPVGVLGTGARYVYLKVTYTLNTSFDFVHSVSLTAKVIEVLGAEQADPVGPNSSGIYYILLASFQDGAKTGQPVRGSVSGEVCGESSAAGEARLNATYST